jgi:HTH-type transcriptional regulator, sugar sensing transcriptional regulator
VDAIVRQLQAVGFTLYEAKVYAALVRDGPQNGNELSRSSGVPSSKVYSTVETLIAQGSAQSIKSKAGTQFVARDPVVLIERLRKQYNDPLDFLREKLPPLAHHVPEEAFLSVGGDTSVLDAARRIISASEKEINISLWGPELAELDAAISEAFERGVKVFGMLYSEESEIPPGNWLRHSYEGIVSERVGGRMLSLVADGAETLVARFPTNAVAAGVSTRNPVLTLIVSEYLHHDVVLQRAQIRIGFDEWDRWWQADPELRGAIFGRALSKHQESQANHAV